MAYANDRPKFSKDFIKEVWEQAKDENGEVWVKDIDGNDIKIEWDPQNSRYHVWDMGHISKAKYSKLYDDYMNHRITKEQFLAQYYDEGNYQVEDWLVNQSHINE